MTTTCITPLRWWPGRTDEVLRVADRLRKLDQPDGNTTIGELARKTRSDVFIVTDALLANTEISALCESAVRLHARERNTP